MAALASSHSKSSLGEFYTRLVNKGKKKIVALVAVMRKLIVIATAKLKELMKNNPIFAARGA